LIAQPVRKNSGIFFNFNKEFEIKFVGGKNGAVSFS